MSGGLRYETGRDMPPGMQEKVAAHYVKQLTEANTVAGPNRGPQINNFGGNTMSNYIVINGRQIELTEEQARKLEREFCLPDTKLSDYAAGDTVRIGSHEMIVMDHAGGATLLLRKDLLDKVRFGENNNYAGSNVDTICNDFAEEIAEIVGEENIILHDVDLTADDGLKDYGVLERKASLLTAQQCRTYVEILDKHKVNSWWWLATAFSTPVHDNDNWVKCVSPSGVIGSDIYHGNVNGVRPFCILKSDIFVSK